MPSTCRVSIAQAVLPPETCYMPCVYCSGGGHGAPEATTSPVSTSAMSRAQPSGHATSGAVASPAVLSPVAHSAVATASIVPNPATSIVPNAAASSVQQASPSTVPSQSNTGSVPHVLDLTSDAGSASSASPPVSPAATLRGPGSTDLHASSFPAFDSPLDEPVIKFPGFVFLEGYQIRYFPFICHIWCEHDLTYFVLYLLW